MGDNKQLYIFDIDSALDRLENEENENQETFPTINTETQSQIQNNEITKQQQQQQHSQDCILQQASEKEENGNVSTLNNTSTIIYEDSSSIDNKGKLFLCKCEVLKYTLSQQKDPEIDKCCD
jgi:predicted amidohydrolase